MLLAFLAHHLNTPYEAPPAGERGVGKVPVERKDTTMGVVRMQYHKGCLVFAWTQANAMTAVIMAKKKRFISLLSLFVLQSLSLTLLPCAIFSFMYFIIMKRTLLSLSDGDFTAVAPLNADMLSLPWAT